MHVKEWRVDVFISEEGDDTHARAILHTEEGPTVTGQGSARRNPHDPQVPEIGDEMAVARALEDLGERLLRIGYLDTEVAVADSFRAG